MTPGGFHIIGMFERQGRLGCKLVLPDYVDCNRLSRTVVMMSASSWALLAVHSVGHSVEQHFGILAEQLVEFCVVHSAVCCLEDSAGYFAG